MSKKISLAFKLKYKLSHIFLKGKKQDDNQEKKETTNSKINNKNTGMENLQITKENAIKAYENGCPDVKRVLENLFGKEAFSPKEVSDEINNINDIYKKLNCNPDKDVLNIDGFDEGQTNVIRAIIKKMRVCEVYNGAKKLTFQNQRWYNWYKKGSAGAGLVFLSSGYGGGRAVAGSAARLSLKDQKSLDDVRKKFPELDLDIIDLK
jgi:hypothetical protein